MNATERKTITDLWIQGYTRHYIAKTTGWSPSTVYLVTRSIPFIPSDKTLVKPECDKGMIRRLIPLWGFKVFGGFWSGRKAG